MASIETRAPGMGPNLRESRQRVDVVGVDLDQIVHEEEQE